jgi:hypothetical protein
MSIYTSWSWLWPKCNRLLSFGRPCGAVTLPRWCDSTGYPDYGRYGDLPLQGKIRTEETEFTQYIITTKPRGSLYGAEVISVINNTSLQKKLFSSG